MRVKASDLLLVGIVSTAWSISLLRKSLTVYPHSHPQFFDQPIDDPYDNALLRTASNHTKPPNNSTNAGDTEDIIETVLIIATAPYKADHVIALWTHLECITSGIDKVLISAPDTPWSREIILALVEKFNQLLRESNNTTLDIDTSFHTNNRYDVGLWCDGLGLHLGFDGHHFPDRDAAGAPPRAIFLINDSTIALRQYTSLTDRIVKSSRMEQLQNQKNETPTTPVNNNNAKLVSLNGNLIEPGQTKNYWVESVYRGFTPRAISTFYQHSCTAAAGRACVGKIGNDKKKCIVNRYEKSLADAFLPSEVDAIYPSYMPKEWENFGQIGSMDQWIGGRNYFRYLYEAHDFPFRKVKWPGKGAPAPPKSQCIKLLYFDSWFHQLPYPSGEVFKAYQEAMLKSESTL